MEVVFWMFPYYLEDNAPCHYTNTQSSGILWLQGVGRPPIRLFWYTWQWSLSWPCHFHFKHHNTAWVSFWTSFPFLRSYNSICRLANSDWICCTPRFTSYIGEDCNFIRISNASACYPTFCCDNGNHKWGNDEEIHQYVCCSPKIYELSLVAEI